MTEHHAALPLPPAKTLSNRSQIRLLLIGFSAILLIWLVATIAGWLFAAKPVAVQPLPPGTFRPTSEQLKTLKIELVQSGDSTAVVTATGQIAVDDDHSTPVILPYSGQVTQVLVEAGARVRRGQALLRIKTSDFVDARNGLFSAVAQNAAARSQLRVAQENAVRQAEIYKTAGGALKDNRQAQNDLVTAQSALRTSESAVGAARDKLVILGKTSEEIRRLESSGEISGIHAETTLHAPVDGTVASRAVSVGQYVSAGGATPVMTVADLTHVWLVAQLAESESAQVHVGDTVEVATPAYPGRVFHAVIDNIAAGLDPVTHRLPVRASVANADLALKPQMFANFTIRHAASGSSVITVPASAVIHEGEESRIWIAMPNGLLQTRSVAIGDSRNGKVAILSGLRPGERVVTAGAIFVNEAGMGE
ncbi:MAG: efflux transporter periplasmic adaptor subunit [Sphingomonadales bacterium]|nr:efflux transporter periplasmic adaptor subunit [Sphingomonadales bacterium]